MVAQSGARCLVLGRDPVHKMRSELCKRQALPCRRIEQMAGVPQGSGMARKVAIIAGLSSLCLAGFAVAVILTGSNPWQIKLSTSGGDSRRPARPGNSSGRPPRQGASSRARSDSLGTSLPGKVEVVSCT